MIDPVEIMARAVWSVAGPTRMGQSKEIAQAALDALREHGLAVVPVELLDLSRKAFGGRILKDADFDNARSMIAAVDESG